MCHLYCSLVGLIWIWWWKDLPKLSTVSLGTATFMCVHSVVFESSWNGELIIQIYLNYSPFNLVDGLFKVMVVMTEKRLTIHHSTTRTHWECEVRMNELMNGEIFLRWLDSKEVETTLSLLVQWFLRVLIWCLIIVDIPKLPSDVIRFRDRSFKYTYSLRSFSILLFVSHHVMLLLSNRSLKAKVITYNPHHLFFLSITIHLGDYYSLNNQLYNHHRICVIALNYEMQGFTHSFSGETRRLRKGYVKSRIPWVSFSQNASGSLINVFHKLQWLTNRVVGKLLTLTSLRLTSLLSFEWYNKYGHPITHSWFTYKDSLIPDLKYVNRNWWILRWNGLLRCSGE